MGQLTVCSLDWGIEGYQLWMASSSSSAGSDGQHNNKKLLQMELVKSPLTANPCMSSKERLYLQSQDRVYINISDAQQRAGAPATNSSQLLTVE